MFFSWEERYDLKIQSMNDEHKVLIGKMNRLYDLNQASDVENTLKAYDDFAEYAVQHFEDEEKFMASIDFPDLKRHQLHHKSILDKIAGFRKELEAEKVLSEAFFNFLKVWLSAHICNIDKQYSDHSLKVA